MESKKNIFFGFYHIPFYLIFIELSFPNMKNKSVKYFKNSFTIGALRKPLLLLKEPYFSDIFIRIRSLNTCSSWKSKKKSQNNNLEDLDSCIHTFNPRCVNRWAKTSHETLLRCMGVINGKTGKTVALPKFSHTLTLSQPGQ